MEYSGCQHQAECNGCCVVPLENSFPETQINAAGTAQISPPGLLVMDDTARWSRPVMRCKGIVTGLIISALFWTLKILVLIKIFTS
jgi:hypothetical protein